MWVTLSNRHRSFQSKWTNFAYPSLFHSTALPNTTMSWFLLRSVLQGFPYQATEETSKNLWRKRASVVLLQSFDQSSRQGAAIRSRLALTWEYPSTSFTSSKMMIARLGTSVYSSFLKYLRVYRMMTLRSWWARLQPTLSLSFLRELTAGLHLTNIRLSVWHLNRPTQLKKAKKAVPQRARVEIDVDSRISLNRTRLTSCLAILSEPLLWLRRMTMTSLSTLR